MSGPLKDATEIAVLAQERADLENAFAAARKSEEQWRTMLAAIPTLVWRTSADGSAEFFNQRWHEYTGISFQDAQGSGFRKSETAREVLEINQVIREVLVLARSEMDKRQVALRLELAAGILPVLGDRVQLQQVILNLILNGIEAMSTVEGVPRDLNIATQLQEKGQILVTVRDSGIGFDPALIEQLFAAFYTTKPDRIGIGLSISRSIVENHKGRLWATVNGDTGAAFMFILPTHQSTGS